MSVKDSKVCSQKFRFATEAARVIIDRANSKPYMLGPLGRWSSVQIRDACTGGAIFFGDQPAVVAYGNKVTNVIGLPLIVEEMGVDDLADRLQGQSTKQAMFL